MPICIKRKRKTFQLMKFLFSSTESIYRWSVGILLFEMLTGLPPFRHKNQQVLRKQIIGGKLKLPRKIFILHLSSSNLSEGLHFTQWDNKFKHTLINRLQKVSLPDFEEQEYFMWLLSSRRKRSQVPPEKFWDINFQSCTHHINTHLKTNS